MLNIFNFLVPFTMLIAIFISSSTEPSLLVNVASILFFFSLSYMLISFHCSEDIIEKKTKQYITKSFEDPVKDDIVKNFNLAVTILNIVGLVFILLSITY